MNKWGKQSKANRKLLHPDLIILADAVLEMHDCSLLESFRGEAKQNEYFTNGTSRVQWPEGKHNNVPSEAMDLAPYLPSEDPYDHENVIRFAGVVQATAALLYKQGLMSRRLKWGGSWKVQIDSPFMFDLDRFYDGIHFELE